MENGIHLLIRSRNGSTEQIELVINDGKLGIIRNNGMEVLMINATMSADVMPVYKEKE